MQKNGYVYKSMEHYRRKYLVVMIVSVLLFLWYTGAKLPYLRTEFQGSSPLDTQKFISDTAMIVADERVELGRKDHKLPDEGCYRSNSYWQGGRYLFDIKADSLGDTVKVFSKMVTMGEETQEMDMYRVYTAEVDGITMAVLSYAGQEAEADMTGYLTQMQKPVLAALTEKLPEGKSLEISEYVIDLRNLEMDTAGTDVAIFWIWLVLGLAFWIKLALFYLKPELTATYRQLVRYGDMLTVEKDINTQVTSGSAYEENGELVLEDYIITKSTFKIVVNRNHRAKN